MAVEIVATPAAETAFIRARTKEVHFSDLPAEKTSLFAVRPGISVAYALSTAWALDCCVQDALQRVIAGEDMDANQAFMCKLAMEAAQALRESCGTGEVRPPSRES